MPPRAEDTLPLRFPRRADIQVTSMHFADYKERVKVEVSEPLGAENATTFPRVVSDEKQDTATPSA